MGGFGILGVVFKEGLQNSRKGPPNFEMGGASDFLIAPRPLEKSWTRPWLPVCTVVVMTFNHTRVLYLSYCKGIGMKGIGEQFILIVA